MSGFLLDTNIPSETLRPAPELRVVDWLRTQGKEAQFLSVITLGELRRGITLLPQGAHRRVRLELFIESDVLVWFGRRILSVTQAVSERWGVLDGKRQLAGRPLNIADGLIAATALEHGLTLVTRNAKDFAGLGLTVLNPWDS